jgi:hypothetical protein
MLRAELTPRAQTTPDIHRPRRLSSTTAHTSFSAEERGAMDPELMVDTLTDVVSAAGKLCDLLVPADPQRRAGIRREILTDGTKHNKLFKTRIAALVVHKDNFGSTEYILPYHVLCALLGIENWSDVPEADWRPDSIIYRINLALMLWTVLIRVPDSAPLTTEGIDEFERLVTYFAPAIAGPDFNDHAFNIFLAILRQLCAMRVTKWLAEPTFQPHHVIKDVFYKAIGDNKLAFRHYDALHIQDLSAEQQRDKTNVLQNVASEAIDLFDETNPDSWSNSLDELRTRYPWEQFVNNITDYFIARRDELDQDIEAHGGMDHIMMVLEQEVERAADTRKAAEMRARLLSGPVPNKAFTNQALKAAHQRQKQLEATAANALAAAPATAPARAPTAQMTDPALDQPVGPVDDPWQPVVDDDEPVAQATSPLAQPGNRSLSPLVATMAKSKGKARMIDRQPNAERITFDSQSEYDAAEPQYPAPFGSAQVPYPGTQNKRPYEATQDEPAEFDPTQDEGTVFQTDNRDTGAADERRRLAPQPNPYRPARFSSSIPGPSNIASSEDNGRPAKAPRRNPGSSIPELPNYDPNATAPTVHQTYQQSKVLSRQKTIASTQTKEPRVRQPWSETEESALIDLIGEHAGDGLHYSQIKRADEEGDNVLALRNPEDIRFKARNMKETILK